MLKHAHIYPCDSFVCASVYCGYHRAFKPCFCFQLLSTFDAQTANSSVKQHFLCTSHIKVISSVFFVFSVLSDI